LFCATRVPFPGYYKYLIKNGLCLGKEEWLPKSVETEIEHYRIWKWMAGPTGICWLRSRLNKGLGWRFRIDWYSENCCVTITCLGMLGLCGT
jgi:hypothetical protein